MNFCCNQELKQLTLDKKMALEVYLNKRRLDSKIRTADIVSLLKRSKLEVERNLEQMRALENKMKIHVGYTFSNPLSVDTQTDLKEVRKIMEKK